MSAYQTYLKDCDCSNGGIIIYDYKVICRWCRKPYAKGGVINYEKECFKEVKPDYEIVEMKYRDCIMPYSNNQMWTDRWTIFSVRRLSDNEVFSVGDYITYTNILPTSWAGSESKGCNITHFTLHNGGIYINDHYNNTPKNLKSIDSWQKVKPKIPLFITSDNKNIFPSDKYYLVHDWVTAACYGNPNYKYNIFESETFSTKEAAQEYILLNKPI